MYSGNNILLTILQPFVGEILQTSHTSIILIATSTASRNNGTGMKGAADCNPTKACFPAALIYCGPVGMTSRGVLDEF